jgi:hypothetical protein
MPSPELLEHVARHLTVACGFAFVGGALTTYFATVKTTTCTHLARPFPAETRLEPAGFEHLVFGRQPPAAVTSWLPQTSGPTSDDTSTAGASNMLHSTSPIPQPLPAAFRTQIDSLALLVCVLLRFVQDFLLVYDSHVALDVLITRDPRTPTPRSPTHNAYYPMIQIPVWAADEVSPAWLQVRNRQGCQASLTCYKTLLTSIYCSVSSL